MRHGERVRVISIDSAHARMAVHKYDSEAVRHVRGISVVDRADRALLYRRQNDTRRRSTKKHARRKAEGRALRYVDTGERYIRRRTVGRFYDRGQKPASGACRLGDNRRGNVRGVHQRVLHRQALRHAAREQSVDTRRRDIHIYRDRSARKQLYIKF